MTMKILPKEQITTKNKDSVLIKKEKNFNLKGIKLIQQLSGKSTSNMSTDEIMKLTRGEFINRFRRHCEKKLQISTKQSSKKIL